MILKHNFHPFIIENFQLFNEKHLIVFSFLIYYEQASFDKLVTKLIPTIYFIPVTMNDKWFLNHCTNLTVVWSHVNLSIF